MLFMPVCFQRNLMTFAKARPAQMIFITTSKIIICRISLSEDLYIPER